METSSMDFNVRFGINKLWRWKWWIVVACVVAGTVSTIFALKMKDEFKSSAGFVPPSFTSLGTMVFGNGIAYRGFYAADEEDIDRTVSYLESTEVIDRIEKKFDLYEHYGIEKTEANAEKKFYNRYNGNVNISFGSNSVVQVEVWDVDREYAAKIAAIYLEIASEYFEEVSNRQVGLEATRTKLAEIEKERTDVLDSLAYYRSTYKVYHVDHAGEAVTNILAQQMKNEPKFHLYYDKVKAWETYISTLELRYGDLRREVMARELNVEQFPELIWITERPTPSPFKDRPKRSIIILFSVLTTAVFGCFLVLVLDRSKK